MQILKMLLQFESAMG